MYTYIYAQFFFCIICAHLVADKLKKKMLCVYIEVLSTIVWLCLFCCDCK